MIIFSDLHLCEASAETVFREVLPGLDAAAMQSGDHELACLGDFWHVRYKVPVVLQNETHNWLRRFAARGCTLRLLPGNHDQVSTDGENALQVFSGMPGVRVYTNPTWDKDGFWIPYRQDPKDIAAALGGKVEPGSPLVLYMHHGVRGALMNDTKQDTEGLPLGMFDGFKLTFCGHYHKRQNVGKQLFYVGSPYQVNAGEAGQEKGYTIWRDGKLQHVTMRWGKRYHLIEMAQKGQIPLPADVDLTRDEVRVTTKAGVDAGAVGKALVKMGVVNHVVTPEAEATAARLQVGTNATLAQFARAYVAEKAQGPEGESDRLWRVFQEITGAAS